MGQAINALGSGGAPIAVAFAVLKATDSASALGIVMASRELAALLLSTAGGLVVARFAAAWSLLLTNVIAGGAQVGFALTAHHGVASVPVFAGFALVNGAMSSLASPAAFSVFGQLAAATSRRTGATALFRAASTGGLLAGAALAGLLVSLWGPYAVLLADGVSYWLAAALFFASSRPSRFPRSGQGATGNWRGQLARGLSLLRSTPWAWRVILASAGANGISTAVLSVLGPVIAVTTPAIGSVAWGIVLASSGLGALVGAALAPFLTSANPLRASLIACLGESLPLFCLALFPNSVALCLAQFVAGIGFGMFEVVWLTVLQERFDETDQSHVFGWDQFLSGALLPPGQLLIAPAAQLLGLRPVLLAGASLVALSVPWTLSQPDVRRM
ncbi:MAG: MFS transporter [Nocardioides sp.]|uniref:MFS transporter n=1 Tax=Nocardioides sp. TaxID=35761 RepID=UPI0039E2A536